MCGANLADPLETWHSRLAFSAPGIDTLNQCSSTRILYLKLGGSRRINQSETAQRFLSAVGGLHNTILSDGC